MAPSCMIVALEGKGCESSQRQLLHHFKRKRTSEPWLDNLNISSGIDMRRPVQKHKSITQID